MMQAAFFEAVINRRHRVLGRTLHDFCLADALALTFAENPLWIGGRLPVLADLEEAVLICSLPHERFTRAELMPRSLFGRLRRGMWLGANSCRNFKRELVRWITYVNDFYAEPETWEPDDEEGGERRERRELRAPWIYSLTCFIEQYSNMTEREILSAPIGLMLWKAETIAERNNLNIAQLVSAEEERTAATEFPPDTTTMGNSPTEPETPANA